LVGVERKRRPKKKQKRAVFASGGFCGGAPRDEKDDLFLVFLSSCSVFPVFPILLPVFAF
jgi:hypothetical protein